MLKGVSYTGVVLVMGSLFFAVTSHSNQALTLTMAALAGGAALALVRVLAHNGEAPGELTAMVLGAGAVALGGALKVVYGVDGITWADPVGALVAQGVAWGADAATAGTGRACFVCKSPLRDESPFTCPRCHQTICELPTCWVARRFRCQLCDEREVVLFPAAESWWAQRVGPRVREGTCSSCYGEAGEADLRSCGRCRWTMCRRCWDYHNGRCTHCDWVMPELPDALARFLPANGGDNPVADPRLGARRQ
jgi:hypothetical protein